MTRETCSDERPPSAYAEELAHHHWSDLVRYAERHLCCCRFCAEDVAADALVRLLSGGCDRHRISTKKALAYALAVVRYTAKERRRSELRLRQDTMHHDVGDPHSADTVKILDRVAAEQVMQKALEQLPSSERNAWVRYGLYGESTIQIASDDGTGVAAVWQRLSRGRRRIRRYLGSRNPFLE
jgi:RNA polymerase sigma factor (sigma-70 family)